MPNASESNVPRAVKYSSPNVLYFDVHEKDTFEGEPTPLTPEEILRRMRTRLKYLGSPLPENYIPPPGIDLEALLKQVPWPPVT